MTLANGSSPRPGARLKWFPLVVGGLAVAALLYFWKLSDYPRGWVFLINLGVSGLATLLLLGWVAFFSGLPRPARLGILCGPCVLCGLFFALFRLDCDGDTIPYRAVPRFSKKPHELLRRPATPSGRQPVRVQSAAQDFPQFQGPRRDGEVRGVVLARNWDEKPPKELWRQPIGAGWSGFAIVGDYAFTQEQRGPEELVTCYAWKTGAPVWSHADADAFTSEMGGDGPRATPTVHEARVYTMGAKGRLNCLDAATGELLWTRHVLEEHEAAVTTWGKACSPLIVDGMVVVTGGGAKGPAILAYDAQSGEPRWTGAWDDKGGTLSDCYASPVLAEVADVRLLVNIEDKGVAGYDLQGKQLWRLNWPWAVGHPKVAQPHILPADGFQGAYLLITAGYSSGTALYRLRKSNEGRFATEEVWKVSYMRPKFSNVVIRGDYLYGLDTQFLACLNWRTGQRRWKGDRYGNGQILLVGDVILVQSEDGPVAMVEANPERFIELGRFPALTERTWNTMALAGPYLLVRNDREAACFELPLRASEQ